MKLWIDIGNPSAKRLHKASKVADRVRIYTYREPAILIKEMSETEIYRRDQIEIFAFKPAFLKSLSTFLERDTSWQVLHTQGELSISSKDHSAAGELTEHRCPA